MMDRKTAAALKDIEETATQNGKALEELNKVTTRLEIYQTNLETLIKIANGEHSPPDFLGEKTSDNDNGQEGEGNG